MAKGIIVVDIPERCGKCEFIYTNKYCMASNFDALTGGDKPDWCPIKPLPEKIEYKTRHELSQESFAQGWNDCIDKMLR